MNFTKIGLIVITLFATKNVGAVEVFISGTTAMRDTLPLIMNKICQSTLPRGIYEAGATISGSSGKRASDSVTVATEDPDRRAFKCHTHDSITNPIVATALGINADKDLTIYMSSEIGDSQNGNGGPLDNLLGGSITGIAPLAPYLSPATKQATVGFVDPSNGCNVNGSPDTTLGASNGVNTYGVPVKGYGFVGAIKYTCLSQIIGHTSEIGSSEVEPSLYTLDYQNLPSSLDNSIVPIEWQTFSVSALYSNATPPSSSFINTYGIVVQDTVPASAVANLTQIQLANILGGRLQNWRSIGGPDLPIKICTRPSGTGIKSALNQLVSRVGCKANALGAEYSVVIPDAIHNNTFRSTTYGAALRENLTTKEMQNCMTDNKTAQGDSTQAAGGSAANVGAIGFIGLDSVQNTPTNAGYHFVAYNGVNPVDLTRATDTVDGTADGVRKDIIAMGYPLWLMSSIQLSPSVSDANKIAFFQYLGAYAGSLEFTIRLPGLMTYSMYENTGTHTIGRGDVFYNRGDTCGIELF